MIINNLVVKMQYSPYGQRKQNFESFNRSPSTEQSNAKRTAFQQRQIEELEQKVDIILLHNEQLLNDNTELRKALSEGNKDPALRIYAGESQLHSRHIKTELTVKQQQCDNLHREITVMKDVFTADIQSLTSELQQMAKHTHQIESEKIELTHKLKDVSVHIEREIKRALFDHQSAFQTDKVAMEQEHRTQIREVRQEHADKILLIEREFQKEKEDIVAKKLSLVNRLQENQKKELHQVRKTMENQFRQQFERLEHQTNQRCKGEREKAEEYFQSIIGSAETEDKQLKEDYQKDIKFLREAVESKKQFIVKLLESKEQNQSAINWFDDVLVLRQRIKELVCSFLKESQILKVKMAQKHELDVQQMSSAYQDRIDVLSCHVRNLESHNDRLRDQLEEEVRGKLRQKKNFEIEISQLKNLVRKLKVELHGIQEEFKLNIDGVRQNSMTFSMTAMKSMVIEKEKANFYEEENRKLRKTFSEHEKEMQEMKKQVDQKVEYYKEKYDELKEKLDRCKEQQIQKENDLNGQIGAKEEQLRKGFQKERKYFQQVIQELQLEIEKMQQQLSQLRERNNELDLNDKDNIKEIDFLKARIDEKNSEIERLKLEIEVAGVVQAQSAMDKWKIHYEQTIEQLDKDKKMLNQKNVIQAQQLSEMVRRYKGLENTLERTVSTLKKRSQLDQRVIQMGTDTNLVKNLAELFEKE